MANVPTTPSSERDRRETPPTVLRLIAAGPSETPVVLVVALRRAQGPTERRDSLSIAACVSLRTIAHG